MHAKPGRNKKKNIPYLSQEYFIVNHGDIFSFVAMLFVLGMMWRVTTPIASLFIIAGHNVTTNETAHQSSRYAPPMQYTSGRNDTLLCFFYTVICIVLHAVLQEYVLDKLNKRFHLSKTKYSKFNESGQLTAFFVCSIGWAAHLVWNERVITSPSQIWAEYPQTPISLWTKYFFVAQICYWLHAYPELYLQRVKRDEVQPRLVYITLYLVSAVVLHAFNLHRFGLVVLTLNYAVDAVFHVARLLYFVGQTQVARLAFATWSALFVCARVVLTMLAYLTFYVFLAKREEEGGSGHPRDMVSLAEGNFNTRLIRMNGLMFVCVTQAYLMWNFINFWLHRKNERAEHKKAMHSAQKFVSKATAAAGAASKKKQQKAATASMAAAVDEDISALPEADQNIRQRRK